MRVKRANAIIARDTADSDRNKGDVTKLFTPEWFKEEMVLGTRRAQPNEMPLIWEFFGKRPAALARALGGLEIGQIDEHPTVTTPQSAPLPALGNRDVPQYEPGGHVESIFAHAAFLSAWYCDMRLTRSVRLSQYASINGGTHARYANPHHHQG